jgi:hypothetical protein
MKPKVPEQYPEPDKLSVLTVNDNDSSFGNMANYEEKIIEK